MCTFKAFILSSDSLSNGELAFLLKVNFGFRFGSEAPGRESFVGTQLAGMTPDLELSLHSRPTPGFGQQLTDAYFTDGR